MAEDVSAEVAGLISEAKVFGSSENIRHGKYLFVIRRIHAQVVEIDKGRHKMAFWELSPLKSEPSPQVEGDRVDYAGPTAQGTGPLKDDGLKPNPVGSNCALKVDFDGPGGRSAGGNIKDAILALFGKRDGEISNDDINKTWIDLSRTKALKKGDAIGINPQTNQPIFSQVDKIANPACGMLIACSTMPKKKKTANDKGAYITKLIWACVNPPGQGENAPELVAKRRAEIEVQLAAEEEEAAEAAATAGTPTSANPFATAGAAVAPVAVPVAVVAAPVVAPPPPAPPAPAAPPFTPSLPWVVHPSAPGYFWSDPSKGGSNAVKSEAQLRAGQ